MNNSVNSEVYADIDVIIGMMPTEMKNKISKGFIKFIKQNKDENYKSSINPKIPLREQELRKETKEFLGIIYRDYLCSEEKRIELIKKEKEEIKDYEEMLREKYNPENMFKENNNDVVELKNDNNKTIVKTETDNIFKKLIKCIKNFLHIK